jgi:hypothetical protein
VTQVLAGRRLLSEQKSIAAAPQGNSAEAPQKSAEAPQKSAEAPQGNSAEASQKSAEAPQKSAGAPQKSIAEAERKDSSSIDCLDASTSTATSGLLPSPLEVPGTVVTVDYQLRVTNNCGKPVDSTLFYLTEEYTCPENCAAPGSTAPLQELPSVPSTLGVPGQGYATENTLVYCVQQDSNGQAESVVPPETIIATFNAGGNRDGNTDDVVISSVEAISVYP